MTDEQLIQFCDDLIEALHILRGQIDVLADAVKKRDPLS